MKIAKTIINGAVRYGFLADTKFIYFLEETETIDLIPLGEIDSFTHPTAIKTKYEFMVLIDIPPQTYLSTLNVTRLTQKEN